MTATHALVVAAAATVGYRLVSTVYAAAGRAAARVLLEAGIYLDVVAVTIVGRFLSTGHERAGRRDTRRAASWTWRHTTFVVCELENLGRLVLLFRASVHRDYSRIRVGRLVLEVYPNLRPPVHPASIDVDRLAEVADGRFMRHGDYDQAAETFVRRARHSDTITRENL